MVARIRAFFAATLVALAAYPGLVWRDFVAVWNALLAETLWRLVFWWKKQTGWLDLGEVIEVTGIVVMVDTNVTGLFNDGDVCFNVRLDVGLEKYITGFGGRLTSEDGEGPSLHCEITPWTRKKFDGTWQRLALGQRVRVKGRWGFDGVHLGVSEPLEVLAALPRHMPNVRDGWFEIHPVEELEILA